VGESLKWRFERLYSLSSNKEANVAEMGQRILESGVFDGVENYLSGKLKPG
jgi:hypothetical protein